MTKAVDFDLCIIGAGSGGLSIAAGAVQMGASVALIERGKMGGDCLNYGCVPSKSLIAAARKAQGFNHADLFGIQSEKPIVDFNGVHNHIQHVISQIEPNDSVERFTKLGVTVFQGHAEFFDKNTVLVNDTHIKARYIIIATGSSARVPQIPGLDKVNYLTNETIFNLTERPDHLVVIGGGPVGCELAQAYTMLGVKVTLLTLDSILANDDPDCVAVVRQSLVDAGLQLYENATINSVSSQGNGFQLSFTHEKSQQEIQGSHLLVAVGRTPNINNLNLAKAGVDFKPEGIVVDKRLRTSNKKIYAIGDVAGGYLFTHIANYHAGIVIRNILFKLPSKVSTKAVPWVTYTTPELAHVGLTEKEAQQRYSRIKILTYGFDENDRAQTEYHTRGQIKVICSAKGHILGSSIVGHNAGELILPWVLAINNKLKIGALANVIVPYPTLSEISKRVAGSYFTPMLFSKRTKKIVKFLLKFGK